MLIWQSFWKMQLTAFLIVNQTYCASHSDHTMHFLSRIRQQETFVVDQGFGVGGRGFHPGKLKHIQANSSKFQAHPGKPLAIPAVFIFFGEGKYYLDLRKHIRANSGKLKHTQANLDTSRQTLAIQTIIILSVEEK